tara:strand:- start:3080 stop:3265 length:186 start_codon:yes stop_codon:yes gene_type:complete
MANSMEEDVLRLQCLQLAQSGSPENSIKVAQQYFDWIVSKPKDVEQPMKRKRNKNSEKAFI